MSPSVVIFRRNFLNHFDALKQRKLLTLELQLITKGIGSQTNQSQKSKVDAQEARQAGMRNGKKNLFLLLFYLFLVLFLRESFS